MNTAGREMPADAAPLDQQVLRYAAPDLPIMDVSSSVYQSNSFAYTVLFEGLGRLNKSEEVIPGAAEKWEVSADKKTWTFHLRRDGKWSDGKPVTAQDFEYSYKKRFEPKRAYDFSWFYMDIKGGKDFLGGKTTDPSTIGVKAVDDYTLTIETVAPVAYIPMVAAFRTSMPVPKHIEEKYGENWSTNMDTMVFNGSFKMSQWKKGQSIEMVPNPVYSGPYKPYLEKLVLRAAEDATHFTMYEAGEIDLLIWGLSAGDQTRVEADPNLSKDRHAWTQFLTWYLFFQTKKPPFDNLKVRQAISHSVDREALSKSTLKGIGIPANTMLPPGFPAYADDKLKDIQKYDPALAKKLLAEAGYADGSGFPKVDMWMRAPAPWEKSTAEAIQQMLKQNLGIDVQPRPQERKIYMDAMGKYEIPMSLIGYGYDYFDPNNLLGGVWHSQPTGGRHDWQNAEFDKLVEQAATEFDLAKREKMYNDAERILLSDVGGVMVYYPIQNQLWKPWVKGWSLEPNKAGVSKWVKNNNQMVDIYIAKH